MAEDKTAGDNLRDKEIEEQIWKIVAAVFEVTPIAGQSLNFGKLTEMIFWKQQPQPQEETQLSRPTQLTYGLSSREQKPDVDTRENEQVKKPMLELGCSI